MGNKKKKILAVLLGGALLGTQIPGMVWAEGTAGYTGGICEHHPAHTAECGYQEAAPEQPCRHEHTEKCYEYVTSCVHVHTEDCYPLITLELPAGEQNTEGTAAEAGTAEDAGAAAEPQTELVQGAEPTACTHVCSEDSGCVTKTLNCVHEDKKNADGSITYAVHDESCGYAPAVEGKECTFVCEICSAPEEKEIELMSLSETETEALTVQTGIAAAGSADSEPESSTKNTESETKGTETEETDSKTETTTQETSESETKGTETKETDSETETTTQGTSESETKGTEIEETDPETETTTEGTSESETKGTEIEETDPETETTTQGTSESETKGTESEETDPETETSTEETSGSDAETETDEAVPDEAVAAVQALIDALPSVEEVEKMAKDEQQEVYDKAQDIADAYFDELTEGQQGQVDLTKLMDLMNYFNGQVSTMESVVATVKIGDTTTEWFSLTEALESVGGGTEATVTLEQDATLSGDTSVYGNVTFVGGNYKVTGRSIVVYTGSTFTIKSGTFVLDSVFLCQSGITNMDGGSVNWMAAGTDGTINVYGGNIDTLDRMMGKRSQITIAGGTIGRIMGSAGSLTYVATGLSLDKSTLPLTKGAAGTITATVTDNITSVNGSTDPIPVVWESNETGVAAVSYSDDGKTATVTAVGPGTATITATAGGKTATCTVTVEERDATTITNKTEDGYPVFFIYGDTIPEPAQSNFNITGSTDGFTCKWYNDNHTTGELPAQTVGKPDAAGTYTLVITTAENTDYYGGELRLLVTVKAAEYHITIPSSADAGGEEVSVSITEGSTFNISSNGKVRVTVSSGAEDGKVTLTRQNDGEDPAEITSDLLNKKGGSALQNGGTVALYDASKNLTDGTTGKLYCAAPQTADGTDILAGTYSGEVTFQVSYEVQQGGQTE